MFDIAAEAFMAMIEPARLMYLTGGVLIGLCIGVIPGLGGIVGMALLLPFTFEMDAYSAFAFLLGMGAVTTTSDTIPAVLFGVPGTVGSAATVLDGHPMAKKGQAGRAFGAAYSASLIGGVFGAMLLAVSIPVLRPIMLYMGSPELLAFSIFGLSMVAALSGGMPLRGLAVAGFGLLVSMIGADPQTGTLRWTLDTLYLWDGLPLVPITLGLFALPELADMAIARRSIAGDAVIGSRSGQWQGVKDTLSNKWLVIRCSWLGSSLGAVPGLGSSVIDWIAYGHAARTEKGAEETFGKGDVRGVIASESSNNAKEGGALVPTIAFGVPGSASMAILLGAFLIHGLVPGPNMLSTHLDVTYAIVWSVALANILGAGICFMASDQLAKIATIRQPVIMPLILGVLFIGAFQGSRQWGDFHTLLIFGLIGWGMKRMRWPRPPLILGVVLGGIVERYMFISVERYGLEWLQRPIVIFVFILAVIGLSRPFFREVRRCGGIAGMYSRYRLPRQIDGTTISYLLFIGMVVVMLSQVFAWRADAQIAPLVVCSFVLSAAVISLGHYLLSMTAAQAEPQDGDPKKPMHMDLESDYLGVDRSMVIRRAVTFLLWLLTFLALVWLVGVLPTLFIFTVAYMRVDGSEPWRLVLSCAAGLTGFSYFLFERMLVIPWPQTLLGEWLPILHEYIPSM